MITRDTLDKALAPFDTGAYYLNAAVGRTVVVTTVAGLLMSADDIAKLYAGEIGVVEFAIKMGLVEKVSDAVFHLYSERLTKDSSVRQISVGILFDIARIAMAYHYGNTQSNTISNYLVVPDITIFHPVNLIANGARLLNKSLNFFTPAAKEEAKSSVHPAAPNPTNRRH